MNSWKPEDYQQVLEQISDKKIRERRQQLDNLIKADATFEAHKAAAEKLIHLIAEGFPAYKEKELFRGRLWPDENKLPGRVEELLAPPPSLVTEYGRLNQPGESLFYAAETTHTIVKELRAQPGDGIAFVKLSGKRHRSWTPTSQEDRATSAAAAVQSMEFLGSRRRGRTSGQFLPSSANCGHEKPGRAAMRSWFKRLVAFSLG